MTVATEQFEATVYFRDGRIERINLDHVRPILRLSEMPDDYEPITLCCKPYGCYIPPLIRTVEFQLVERVGNVLTYREI